MLPYKKTFRIFHVFTFRRIANTFSDIYLKVFRAAFADAVRFAHSNLSFWSSGLLLSLGITYF